MLALKTLLNYFGFSNATLFASVLIHAEHQQVGHARNSSKKQNTGKANTDSF